MGLSLAFALSGRRGEFKHSRGINGALAEGKVREVWQPQVLAPFAGGTTLG